jgi:N-ethylmaleimide reductase
VPPSDSSSFKPVTTGDLPLPNRIVMAPLTRNRSGEDGVPPDFGIAY